MIPPAGFLYAGIALLSELRFTALRGLRLALFLFPRKRILKLKCQLLGYFILFQLIPYIFFYLFCIFPDRIRIIASTPELAISIFKPGTRPLFIDHLTTLPFQISHKSRYTQLWWYFQKNVYMIYTYFGFENINSFPLT